MPPKPRILRKVSFASKDGPDIKAEGKLSKDMPPPPDPVLPLGILEAEMNSLSGCLKNAVVKTGQVYQFHSDTRRLGIRKHSPRPPESLTASLGREAEKYDQLCDAIESHMLRAISVLQRDLSRERKRLEEAEFAAAATRTRTQSPTPPRVPTPADSAPSAEVAASASHTNILSSPPLSASGPGPGRRPSAISLSSLHRPPFPHKLDLSSSALRMTAEDASMFNSGLASPVTLAPRSAKPTTGNEIPDIMAAFVSASDAENPPIDIDLTVPDNNNSSQQQSNGDLSMAAPLGSSADKPIELDLEGMDIDMSNMSDLFGDSADTSSNDANNAMEGLFSPTATAPEMSMGSSAMDGKPIKEEEKLGMEILDVLSAVGDGGPSDDIFSSLNTNNSSGLRPLEQSQHINMSALSPGNLSGAMAPSPGSLLASFASSQMNTGDNSTSSAIQTSGDAPFDLNSLDLSHLSPGFFSTGQGSDINYMEMEDLLNMNGEAGEAEGSKS